MKIKSKFYKIYFSVIAVFAVLLTIMLFSLNGWLKGYEAAQPETLVNGIINEYINKNNIYGINKITNLDVSCYETEESINSAIAQITNGKTLTASSSATRIDGCDLAYTVKADGQKIINIYLKKTEGSSSLLARYEIMEVSLSDTLYKTAKIVFPANTEIKINGNVLKAEDIQNEELPAIPEKYKQNILPVQYAEIKNLVSDGISVSAASNGVELPVTQSGTQYTVAQNNESALTEKITSFAQEASKTYSAYMQNDSSLTAIRKYFATDTEFYENLRTSLVIFALDHNGYRFEDVKTQEFYKFSENIYRCRITLTQVLIKGGSEYKDYFDKNVYVYYNNGNMSVIDLRSSGEEK